MKNIKNVIYKIKKEKIDRIKLKYFIINYNKNQKNKRIKKLKKIC
jgi:hypothetical protein